MSPEILQVVIVGLASWNLYQTHNLSVQLASLRQQIQDLRCLRPGGACPNPI